MIVGLQKFRRESAGRAPAARHVACSVAALLGLAIPSAAAPPIDFRQDLYARLEAHNCRACHNASGVASETRLHFPEQGAPPSAIQRFGENMHVLVDRNEPGASLLLAKPTNRIPHTGGPLIAAGSEDERLLAAWAEHLATRSAPQRASESGPQTPLVGAGPQAHPCPVRQFRARPARGQDPAFAELSARGLCERIHQPGLVRKRSRRRLAEAYGTRGRKACQACLSVR